MNLCLPYTPCLVHPLWMLHGNLGAPVCHMCVPVKATPCLECVHASVHEFMSTLHPMSGPPPMDSYMESWVPLCVTACVSQSPYFCCYTLFRMCTCISTWIYVHLAAYVWSTPMHSLMETWVPLYGSVFVSQSSHFCCHTLFRMCTCISTWIYVYLTPHVWSTPYG